MRFFSVLLLGLALASPLPGWAEESVAESAAAIREAERAVAAAGAAAEQERNDVAAVLYEWAIALAPSRRMEWLRDLADQMAFSDRSRQAVPLYRELLAAGSLSPGEERETQLRLAQALRWGGQLKSALGVCDSLLSTDSRDIAARLSRAETLAWMDCHASAKREYEAVLRQDSQNAEAQRKLAQLQSWRGKHQDARRRLIAYLRTHPNDGLDRFEGMLFLAQAEKELGLTDQARATISDLLARLPPDRLAWLRKDALQLMDEMEDRRRPGGGLAFQSSEQSDDLSISVASLQQDLTLNGGRTTVGPRYQRWDYEPERGPTPVVVQRPGVYARHRFSEESELTGTLFVDRIEPERGAKERTVLTYDTYLTLRPNDLLRFYIGSNRTTFDNVKSLLQGISATQASVSMDVVPDQRTGLAVRFNWSDYTDGNRHRWAQFEVKRQVWRRRNLFLGARYTTIDFAEQLDNGYFNPKSYRSLVATLNVWGHSGDRFYYNLEGAYGRENAMPGGAKPFSSGGVRLTYELGERMDLEAGWSFFSTKQESSGGFARRTASVSFRYGL